MGSMCADNMDWVGFFILVLGLGVGGGGGSPIGIEV